MKDLLPLEAELSGFFLNSLPAFSAAAREYVVNVLPYAAVGTALLFLLYAALSSGLLSGYVSVGSVRYLLWYAAGTTASVLALMAFSPLRNRLRQGWRLLYYAQWSVVGVMLLSLSVSGLLLMGFAGFWVMFQVREKYI
jgi:uncharacterized integral membrane protein